MINGKNCIMINGKKLHYDKRSFKVAGGGLATWNKKLHYDKREKLHYDKREKLHYDKREKIAL